MAIHVMVPVSTEVIEQNPDCQIYGVYEGGRLVIVIDTRQQNHHQRLGIGTNTADSFCKSLINNNLRRSPSKYTTC